MSHDGRSYWHKYSWEDSGGFWIPAALLAGVLYAVTMHQLKIGVIRRESSTDGKHGKGISPGVVDLAMYVKFCVGILSAQTFLAVFELVLCFSTNAVDLDMELRRLSVFEMVGYLASGANHAGYDICTSDDFRLSPSSLL